MAKKILQGVVVSMKMQGTAVVRVERKFRHSLYKKVLKKHKNYKVSIGEFKLKKNDLVKIEETRPLSKDKHFRIIKVFKKNK